LCPILCQYEVNDGGGDGEQGAVEAVKHAAVAGKNLAAVLDAELPLDEALHKVAPCAEHDDDEGKAQPALQRHCAWLQTPDDDRCRKGEYAAADAAYPRLLGRNAGEELVGDEALQQAAAKVGEGVVHPQEDEKCKGIYPIVHEDALLSVENDAESRQQGKGKCDVYLRGEAERPVPQRRLGVAVKLADNDVDEQQAVEREHLARLRVGNRAEPNGSDKHDACHRIDGANHVGMDACIHQRAELP